MAQTLNPRLEYTGKKQPEAGEINPKTGQILYPYLPSPNLVEVVNLAIFLKRPLLIKGEPGCGKTRLAHAVAYELGLPLEAWYIKSTTRARDGLYTYDAVGRLRDAQLAASRMIEQKDIPRISDPSTYIRWGALGRAFRNNQRTVVLIDEIDKADIDFPNDLLLELDEQRFFVEETGEEIQAKASPIVLITSNNEKDLPDAFLRRCLFHYIEFLDKERLIEIIDALFPKTSNVLVEKAVERFIQLRRAIQKSGELASKNVSTSELVDWFTVLRHHPEDEILAKLNGTLPYPSILLKSWEDHQKFLIRTDS